MYMSSLMSLSPLKILNSRRWNNSRDCKHWEQCQRRDTFQFHPSPICRDGPQFAFGHLGSQKQSCRENSCFLIPNLLFLALCVSVCNTRGENDIGIIIKYSSVIQEKKYYFFWEMWNLKSEFPVRRAQESLLLYEQVRDRIFTALLKKPPPKCILLIYVQ